MPEKEMTSRQIKADRTKARIYECAMQLFREKRYESVKIVDICNKADVSVGTFYYYFKSKEDIVEHGFSKYKEALESVLDSYMPVSDPLENIRYCVQAQARTIMDFSKDLAVIFSYRLLLAFSGDFNPQCDSHNFITTKFLTQQVKKACDEGIFKRNLSVDTIVEAIRRQSRSAAYEWCLYGFEKDLEKMRMFDLELLLDSLALKK